MHYSVRRREKNFPPPSATVTDVQYRLLSVVQQKYSASVRMQKKLRVYGWLPAKLAVSVEKKDTIR